MELRNIFVKLLSMANFSTLMNMIDVCKARNFHISVIFAIAHQAFHTHNQETKKNYYLASAA